VALAHRNDRALPRPARALADQLARLHGEGSAEGMDGARDDPLAS
jgi:hypothetical protein